jgi:hypothetical protein
VRKSLSIEAVLLNDDATKTKTEEKADVGPGDDQRTRKRRPGEFSELIDGASARAREIYIYIYRERERERERASEGELEIEVEIEIELEREGQRRIEEEKS